MKTVNAAPPQKRGRGRKKAADAQLPPSDRLDTDGQEVLDAIDEARAKHWWNGLSDKQRRDALGEAGPHATIADCYRVHCNEKSGRDPKRIDQPAETEGKNGRVKQQFIEPGMDPPTIPEIDEAAEEYRRVRDRRMELTKEEARHNELLLGLMKKHNLSEYRYDGTEVSVAKEKEKARVRRIKEESESDE